MMWANYVGIPFADHGSSAEGVDCWGLVRHVLAAEKGWILPSYGEGYTTAKDQRQVTDCIKKGLAEGWDEVADPVEGALVVFRMAGRDHHVGLVCGPDRFIHAPAGERSCVERLSSMMWCCRISGYYVKREVA